MPILAAPDKRVNENLVHKSYTYLHKFALTYKYSGINWRILVHEFLNYSKTWRILSLSNAYKEFKLKYN